MAFTYRYLYRFLHVLAWGSIYFLLGPKPVGMGIFSLDRFNDLESVFFFSYGFALNVILFYSVSFGVVPYLLRRKGVMRYLLLNAAIMLGMVLVESAIDTIFMKYVYEHFRQPGSWEQVENPYYMFFLANLTFTAFWVVVANLYGVSRTWVKEQRNRHQLEQEKLKAELSALKHQINPHFLFNILNGLYGLAFRNDDEPTAEGIAKLSQLMRYMLYESNGSRVPLSKEIEYIENYIDLQKIRTHESTLIHFSVRGNIDDKQIAPMLFMPFIENAFKYGISTVKPSEIIIKLEVVSGQLDFRVSNPIHRVNSVADKSYSGIGLNNVYKRLDLLYRDAYELQLGEKSGQYLVHLTINL